MNDIADSWIDKQLPRDVQPFSILQVLSKSPLPQKTTFRAAAVPALGNGLVMLTFAQTKYIREWMFRMKYNGYQLQSGFLQVGAGCRSLTINKLA